jgi:1-acyl-sn-glycerol-3-phosphate acyltransferase
MLNRFRAMMELIVVFAALGLLGVICLLWTILAAPLLLLLPERRGADWGRRGILIGFRFYAWSLQLMGVYRLDLRALRELRNEKSLILAPNHPSLIDAVLIMAHNDNIACVMKSSLMNNAFLGIGARLARHIRNKPTLRMISDASAELDRGAIVLLFPEGTRTATPPVNKFTASVGIISKRTGAPVQTLIIDQESRFLGSGWSMFNPPSLPVAYRMRLGRRFEPPTDVREFTTQLEQYFRAEIPVSID